MNDQTRRRLLLKATGLGVLAIATAAVFASYLRPDLMLAVWNVVLLCF
ncbi:MAG: hypothetical protein HY017_03120 [Betaproteobacteria bacterium]|nr:hypothetical protein [Betaproteobacteria bacterium]